MPQWRGQGIGTSMLDWAEERLRKVAADQKETGTVFFGANATETEMDDTALLLNASYRRSFAVVELERGDLNALPDMRLPEGIVIRPLLPEHFLAVGRSVTECYLESSFAVVPSDDQDQKQNRWLGGFEPSLCFVAWDGDEVAGQVLCRIEKGRGEMAEVSIARPGGGAAWQKLFWRRRCMPFETEDSAERVCTRLLKTNTAPSPCIRASASRSSKRMCAIESR